MWDVPTGNGRAFKGGGFYGYQKTVRNPWRTVAFGLVQLFRLRIQQAEPAPGQLPARRSWESRTSYRKFGLRVRGGGSIRIRRLCGDEMHAAWVQSQRLL